MPIEIDPNTGAPIVTPAAPVNTPTTDFVAPSTDSSTPGVVKAPPTLAEEPRELDTTLKQRIDEARSHNTTIKNVPTINPGIPERVNEINARLAEILASYGGQVSNIPASKDEEYWKLRDELRALLNP